MNLESMLLLLVQSVPGGSPDRWLDVLQAAHEKAGNTDPKPDAGVMAIADITRGVTFHSDVYRVIPEALVARVTPTVEDRWENPARLCGREILLSRLRQYVKRGGTMSIGLRDEHHDPTVWTKARFDNAFKAAQLKPPKAAGSQETPVADPDTVDDEGVLAVALLCWYADQASPSPYHDEELVRDPEARKRAIEQWEELVRQDAEVAKRRAFW
jgi:hypothetical protein